MFALVDGNNFYASCERVFRPSLIGKPLVVLSNNDGCAIARSEEAKAMGVRMGHPWHEIRHLERQGLVALSANFALYGDMSDRMMSLIAGLGHTQEVYSIDESFVDLTGIRGNLQARAQAMRDRILQWIGIPTCVGIGETKTLAKLANHVAKDAERKGCYPAHLSQVCNLASLGPGEREALLASIPLKEVWGIGPRLAQDMQAQGLKTTLDLVRMDPATARQRWSVVVERTVRELQGVPCIALEHEPAPKQEIACTRSFGRPVQGLRDLEEAVSEFATRAAEKLRRQGSVTAQVLVFVRTSPFRKTAQYSRSMVVPLVRPTDDTAVIVRAALAGLKAIYQEGFDLTKAGVMLLDLASKDQVQFELGLDAHESDKRQPEARGRLMRAMDAVNARWGRHTVRVGTVAAAGSQRDWRMRQERRTPAYTTCLEDVPEVR